MQNYQKGDYEKQGFHTKRIELKVTKEKYIFFEQL